MCTVDWSLRVRLPAIQDNCVHGKDHCATREKGIREATAAATLAAMKILHVLLNTFFSHIKDTAFMSGQDCYKL